MTQQAVPRFITQHKYFLCVLLLFFIAEVLIQPVGNFPLNDDWAYAKAVLVFNEKTEFNFGVWPAMTLATHILWGSLFTKFLGFSHVVLRLSTVISAIVTCTFLYKLLLKINQDRFVAAFGCALLLFNPIFFNLSNTFMTDINFCALTIICSYYIYRFHESGKLFFYIPVFLFSVSLVLVRQFGIVVPLSFMVSCFFAKDKKALKGFIGIMLLVAVVFMLKVYESYLHRVLPRDPAYKFSGDLRIFSGHFWSMFFIGAGKKWVMTALHIVVYLFPIALPVFIRLATNSNALKRSAVIAGSFIASILLFWKEPFPWQNIFTNMSVGPENFYQSTLGMQHATSACFALIMNGVKIIGPTVTVSSIIFLASRKEKSFGTSKLNPFILFQVFFIGSYTSMLFLTENDFDRYYLPLIISAIVVFVQLIRAIDLRRGFALIPLCFMIYISVAGTRDYFTWNEKRWQAFDFLNRRCGVNNTLINAGFEVTCWNDPDFIVSYDYMRIDKSNFVIQFDSPGKDFRLLAEYPFQRYFPYKKDKINIFVREGNINLYDKPSSKKR